MTELALLANLLRSDPTKKGNNILQHSMSWADADNDGDMDAYCGMSFGTNEFFINTGSSLERLAKDHITLLESGGSTSVNWVDYDNDGDMDLFTTNDIYENKGNLEFEKTCCNRESKGMTLIVCGPTQGFGVTWTTMVIWISLYQLRTIRSPFRLIECRGKTSSSPIQSRLSE